MQESNWLLEILKILAPGIISALLTGLWLTVRTEKLKSQLQAELFEFQTRFLQYHQRKAEAIKELYFLLAQAELELNEINNLTTWIEAFDANMANEAVRKRATDASETCQATLRQLEVSWAASRIYFDRGISEQVDSIKLFFKEMIGNNIALIAVKIGLAGGFPGITVLNQNDNMTGTLLAEKLRTNERMSELAGLRENLETEFRRLSFPYSKA